ncbi:MAG: LysR substrate-binding domain-containing protein [Pseudomonadota bacterium]
MVKARNPPLNSLRAFEAAARHGSFARAADELHVTAGAVSHQIKELEATLGITLFDRKARGVVLTDPGRRYRDRVAEALHIVQQASADLHQPSVDGPLRLSAPMSFAQLWLAPRLGRFSDRFPGIELTMDGVSEQVDLRRGDADVAVRFGAGTYAGVRANYLLGDAVTVLAPAAFIAESRNTQPRQLLRSRILLDDRSTGLGEPWMSWPPWLHEAGLASAPAQRRMRFSDSALTMNACRDAIGLCVGRLSLSLDLLRQRLLVPLFPWRSSEFSYFLLSREEDQGNPRIGALREWLVEEIDDYRQRVASEIKLDLPAPQLGP